MMTECEKKVVISQPRYLPAVNYLQRLYFADLFVILDDVQRQSRGFENRNKVPTDNGVKWLTMPIASSSREIIKNTKIKGARWIDSHKKYLRQCYGKHPYFKKSLIEGYYYDIEPVLIDSDFSYAKVTEKMLINLCNMFGFSPNIVRSSDFSETSTVKGPEKLLVICREVNASTYISGESGRDYGLTEVFKGSKVRLLFHEFNHPTYDQKAQENFVPWLSFFDMLFNVGIVRVKEFITSESTFST